MRRAVEAAERTHIDQSVEYASIINPGGRHVATRQGSEITVSLAGFADQLPGSTVTHNHPDGGSFSFQDVRFAKNNGVGELRIIARVGGKAVSYRLQAPRAGWPAMSDGELAEAYAAAWSRAQDQPGHLELHRTMEAPQRLDRAGHRLRANLPGLEYPRAQPRHLAVFMERLQVVLFDRSNL